MTNDKELRREINNLKNALNELDVRKEKWFSEKETLKGEVINLISQIKKIKFTKDKDNKQVQELKKTRDEYNSKVKELIHQYRELDNKKEKILKDKKIRFDPSKLVKQIEQLEYKIEHEAVSFEAEKKLMNQIRSLKKQLEEAGDVQQVFKNLKSLSESIYESKKKAEEAHRKIRDQIKQDKTSYEDFIKLTKQINELKKKQETAFNNFIESKNKFSEINQQLKNKLRDVKEVNVDREIKHNKEETKILEQKTREVEEKLKKKKKLTTEDLLVFQNSS
ncbi:hypothetical protein J4438_02830 [Candidatus Woesearchaeota archaeon]|nr:hypothetical protein [Candidatus Woesearchaeota archaeon]